MNITDELGKLADLRREGHLTEQEFADAKRQLLLQGAADAPKVPKGQYEGVIDGDIPIDEKTFQSSRWTSGNLFFPDALVLASDGIIFRKGSLMGSSEEHINYNAVASFRINNGILFSTVSIETSGGSQPIVVNGLWKSEAKEIQDAIRVFQRRA
ncbi:MAG TPA: SHOCT domain-containing protein [Geobacteraceae bacterium]|nr:SHOCT domain-containing protein [Geobacteraceae bacterium]